MVERWRVVSSPLPEELLKPISGEFETVLDLFDAVVEQAGSREAFVDGDNRITFGEWARAGDGVANWLSHQGIRAGDVVGLRLPSSIEYAIAYQGIMRIGAITSGINPRLGPSELHHIFGVTDCKLVIDDPAVVRAAALGEPSTHRPAMSGEDPVAIVWTSGTTGLPKGAVFDHGCLKAMAAAAGVLSVVGDRRLSPLPFAHVGYMTRVWDELMHLITTVIVPTPWTAPAAVRLIETEAITVGQGVPTQWQLMLNYLDASPTDVSSLRIAGTGAARVPPELVIAMREKLGCPVVVRYTSTEAVVSTGTSLDDSVEVVANTVGRPGNGIEMRITDDDGNDVAPGEVGIVTLRSRAMMLGYWRDQQRTAEAITADGWLMTGDQGLVGADGNLRLVGRRTEMYIRSGYNIYPAELENCLGGHPGVDRVAVVGGGPVPVQGEIGVAFVVPHPGAEVTIESLRAFARERLADYKAPDVLVLVDDLPLTSVSKVDKKALQAQANEAASHFRR